MDYFVIFQVFWIILLWANFVRLIWYQSKFWSGPWPHFTQNLFELAFIQPLHFGASPIPRFLTKNRLLAIQIFRVSLIILVLDHNWAFSQTQIFRVSLNLVLDHNLTFGHTKFFFWSFSQHRSLTKNPLWPHSSIFRIFLNSWS